MTAVRQLWISRVINLVALVFIYATFFMDWRTAAVSAGGFFLLHISWDGRALWSDEATQYAKRFDIRAAEADAFSKGE
jgi:hypothetical protein